MPPPKLPADAPVALLAQPVEVGLRVTLGEEADAAVADGFHRRLRQLLHLHEPLLAEHRLDGRFAAVAVADLRFVRLDLLHQAERFEIHDHFLARLVPVQARVRPAVLVDLPVRREDVDHLHAVPLRERIVVRVVPRRDLHAAGAEFLADEDAVRDDRDRLVHERQHAMFADQVLIPLVVGVHRDGRIAEHRLRPRRGDDEIIDAELGVGPRRARDRVAGQVVRRFTADTGVGRYRQNRIPVVPQAPLDRLVHDFVVGDGRLQCGIPVDEPQPAVDQPVLEEAEERLIDRPGADLVEREADPRPVARAAHRT